MIVREDRMKTKEPIAYKAKVVIYKGDVPIVLKGSSWHLGDTKGWIDWVLETYESDSTPKVTIKKVIQGY